jgi:hypothetical protein
MARSYGQGLTEPEESARALLCGTLPDLELAS